MRDDDTNSIEAARAAVAELTRAVFGAAPSRLDAIEPGLGSRRFFRVFLPPAARHGSARTALPHTLVARVEREEDPRLRPPGIPPEPPLEPIRRLLESEGLPVPACYATRDGVTLLEDLGDTSLEAATQAGLPEREVATLYAEACSLVPRLQRVHPRDGVAAFSRRLDAALFRYKAEQVVAWALPFAHGTDVAPAAEARVVRDAFAWIAETCSDAPMRLAHRDYKAANLHVCAPTEPKDASDPAPSRLVMIDIQGAFLAPPEYDLVCLLRDSHVALPEPLVVRLLREVRDRLPDAPSTDDFHRRFTLLTLSRNGKDLSRYLYAARERGDERYAALVPRAVDTLKRAAATAAGWDPSLARLADVIAAFPGAPCER